MPYQQAGGGRAAGPIGGPKKSRKGLYTALAIVGVVAIVAIFGVVALAVRAHDKVVANSTRVGDCIADVPTDSLILTVPTIDCGQPHGGEVFAVLTMPEGAYPGSAVIDEWKKKCPPELETFSAGASADPSVGVLVLYPTQQRWDDGDRLVTCIATSDPKRTGSLKQ
jgi:Septum formation